MRMCENNFLQLQKEKIIKKTLLNSPLSFGYGYILTINLAYHKITPNKHKTLIYDMLDIFLSIQKTITII